MAETQIAGELKMDPCVVEREAGMADQAVFKPEKNQQCSSCTHEQNATCTPCFSLIGQRCPHRSHLRL